ncbi:MAG: cell division protein SepF [Clostridia bacterium]|nr:cell division protein SepF [Clostridia bacterium]
MKITDKLSNIIFGDPEQEAALEEELEEAAENEDEAVEEIFASQPEKPKRAPRYNPRNNESNKVVNISTTAQLQMVMVHPVKYADAPHIASNLLEKRTVIVNFESMTDKKEKKQILCFLTGVTFATKGNIKKISDVAYLLTPYNVELTDEKIKADYESGNYSDEDAVDFED